MFKTTRFILDPLTTSEYFTISTVNYLYNFLVRQILISLFCRLEIKARRVKGQIQKAGFNLTSKPGSLLLKP